MTWAKFPSDGNELIDSLAASRRTSGEDSGLRREEKVLTLADYQKYFLELPYSVREQITSRWDIPETDPFFRNGAFHLAILTYRQCRHRHPAGARLQHRSEGHLS